MSDLVFYIGDTIQPAEMGSVLDTLLHPQSLFMPHTHLNNQSPPAAPAKADPLVQYVYGQANKIHALLVAAGVGEPGASYGTYASYHESAAYSSPLYKQHNNATGIKFAGQKGAKKGTNGYAWFDSLQSWASAYAHELKKGSNPAGAANLEDFAARLKKNGYYEDSYDNYLHGLTRARLVLKVIPAADRAGVQPDGSIQDKQDLDIPGSKDYSKFSLEDWWNKRSNLEKGGVIATGIALIVVAAKK